MSCRSSAGNVTVSGRADPKDPGLRHPMFDSLTLSNISKKQCGLLRAPTATRPAIRVVEERGVRAVVKDFSTGRFLFRNTAGRFLVWRESRAYRRLADLDGIPRLYRVIDGLAMVLEEVPGKSLEELEDTGTVPEAFFDALEELVARVHERGVAHCDLKRAPNTLVGEDGRPYIIDWAASISFREFAWFPANRIYRRFLRDDQMAVIKMKLRHVPAAVTREEKIRYRYRGVMEKRIRKIRDRLRRALKRIA